MKGSAFFATTAACVALAGPALALSPPESATALAERADAAMTKRHFHEAIDLYRRAAALAYSPSYVLGMARAEAAAGKLASAHLHYREFLGASETATLGSMPAVREIVQHESEDVSARVAYASIVVKAADGRTSVKLDGTTVDSEEPPSEIEIDPGVHVVTATASTCDPGEARFSVVEGEHAKLMLVLANCSSSTIPVASPTLADSTTPAGGIGTQRILGWSAVGLGATALVAGVIAGVVAVHDNAEAGAACSGVTCGPSSFDAARSAHDSAVLWANVSTVSLVGGLIGVATGVVVVLTAPKERSKPAPYVGFGTMGVAGIF